MDRTNFFELYKRPEWKAKRNKILQRDQYKCQLCGDDEFLNVHHLHYKEDSLPWDVEEIALVTYCSLCHLVVHICIDEFGNGFASYHPVKYSIKDNWAIYTLVNIKENKYKHLIIDMPVLLSMEGRKYKKLEDIPQFCYCTDEYDIPVNNLGKDSWNFYWVIRNSLNEKTQISLANVILKSIHHWKERPNAFMCEVLKHLNHEK